MDINEIRKNRLLSLVGNERGDQARFAKKYSLDASYISQLLNKHRNFGEKAARDMEEACNLPAGYFDISGNGQNGTEIGMIRASLQSASFLTPEQKEYFIGILSSMAKGHDNT